MTSSCKKHVLSRKCLWALAALLCLPLSAPALEPLSDQTLANIRAQDGLAMSIDADTIDAQQINWITDDNGLNDGTCSGGTPDQHACTLANNIELSGVGGPIDITNTLDVGSSGSDAGIYVQSNWASQRFLVGGLTLNSAARNYTGHSVGQLALQTQGSLKWGNRNGLFNNSGNTATFALNTLGDLIYRQGSAGSPELSFGDLVLDARFTNSAAAGHSDALGQVAIDPNGLLLAAPYADVEFTFDLAYKGNPTDFDTTGRNHLLRFGWIGGLVNPVQRFSGGGFGYSTWLDGANTMQDFDGSQTGSRSEGFHFTSEWDFDSDFALLTGEAGGNRSFVRFTGWQQLGAAPGPTFSFPLIFDVFQNGVGPQGLCAGSFTSGVPDQASCVGSGGEWIASNPPGTGEAAFGILLRDAHLHAYSSRIEVIDPLAAGAVTPVNWGLLFTYGKMDADTFIYPEGRNQGVSPSTNTNGLRADITLLAQSPDAWRRANSSDPAVRATAGDGWQTNTHVMVADTNSSTAPSGLSGVGFVNGDLLYLARDLFVRVTEGDSGYPTLPGGLWLQTDNTAIYRFRGIVGGGDLTDLSYDALTKISLMDVNLATNRFIFVLNPLPVNGVTGAAPVGFNGLLNFDNAFLTAGEISSPQSQFYVNNVNGTIAWRNGSLSLVSGQNTSDGLPHLVIQNDLDIGQTASFGGPAGNPLVGTLGFGSEDFGRLAIPTGSWNSEVTVKIP